ncbi:MAG: hypothetical protein KF845_10940 [Cyclobacteriaceae bacterium]|nr:hypothetical protein [Cyclobacteriaceae bacterium]
MPLIVSAQKDKDVSIPLDHFYVDRQGIGFFRNVLSKVHFGLSTGYGSTIFRHNLKDFGIYQPASGNPRLFNPASPANGMFNWFNESIDTTFTINPGEFLVTPDTAAIGFRSKSFNIPLRLTAHVEIKQRFRIGGGYSFEYTKVNDFKPLSFSDDIQPYQSEVSSFFLQKYFLLLGASVYRYDNYLLTVDAHIGGYKLGKKFDMDVIDKGMFFNLGAMVEREMSEYFRLFIRPSYEFKGYNLSAEGTGTNIRHRMNAFYINVGASYRIPELRRCYNKECRAQINHAHGNREYRSRVHPIWKKQNPHHGENYPNLIKYKGKNKRKLNPY